MKVKTKKQIEAERLMLERRPIKRLTHRQLAECLIECSQFYGYHTLKTLLSWYHKRRKPSIQGADPRRVPVKSRIGKVGYEIRELKNYYEKDHAPGVNARTKSVTVEMLLQVDYDALRWVARNIGKAHAERRYGTPQFKYGQGPFGNVSDNMNPADDIPPCTIGNPKNRRKVRKIVPPTAKQLKKWLKESKIRRRTIRRQMRNKPAKDVVKRPVVKMSNRPIKWIDTVAQIAEGIAKTRDAMDEVVEQATKRLLRERKKKGFGTKVPNNRGVVIRVS